MKKYKIIFYVTFLVLIFIVAGTTDFLIAAVDTADPNVSKVSLSLTEEQKEQMRDLGLMSQYDNYGEFYPFKMAKILGLVGDDFQRMTYEEVKEIIKRSDSIGDVQREFKKRQPFCDYYYIGNISTSPTEYWLNDEGTERICIFGEVYYETFDENGKLIESVKIYSLDDQYKKN